MIQAFLLDENLPKWWRRALVRLEPSLSVLRVGDLGAPLLHSEDPVLLDWCEEHHAVLLTDNRKSMPNHLAERILRDRHIPGIFVIDPSINIRNLVEALLLIAGASLENEFQDQITYFPKL